MGAYLVRDLPRRFLEAELARQLEATVSLGGWKMVSQNSWILHDLRVRLDHLPVAVVLEAPVVRIEGRAEDIADGKLRRLMLEHSRLSLELPRGTPTTPTEAGTSSEPPLIDELQIPGMEISLCAELDGLRCRDPVSEPALELNAQFRNLGRQVAGSLALEATSLDLYTPGPEQDSPGIQSKLTGFSLQAALDQGIWTVEADTDELRTSNPDMALRLSDISWQGIVDVESPHGLVPVTQNALLGSGLLTFAEKVLQIPEVRWRAFDPAHSAQVDPLLHSTGSSPMKLAMDSELWQSGWIIASIQGQETSLSLDLRAISLESLLRLAPAQASTSRPSSRPSSRPPSPPTASPAAPIEGKADLNLRLIQDSSSPLRWQLNADLRPSFLNLDTPKPSSLGFAAGTSIQLFAKGEGLPSESLAATLRGSARLPGIEPDPRAETALSSIPTDFWPAELSWQADLSLGELRLEDWSVQNRLLACSGSGSIDVDSPDIPAPMPPATSEPELSIRWKCSGPLGLALAELAPSLRSPDASSTWKAQGTARWQGTEWAADGMFEVSADSLSTSQDLTIQGQVTQDPAVSDLDLATEFQIHPKRLDLSEIDLSMAVQAPGLDSLHSHTQGEVSVSLDTLGQLTWDLHTLELGSSGPAESSADAQASFGQIRTQGESRPGRLHATVQLESPSPAPWLKWLDPWLPSEVRTLETKGELSFQGNLTQNQGTWSLEGPWQGRGLGLASEDGSRVLEGLDFESRVSAHWHPAREAGSGRMDLKADGHAGGFLMLWQTLFSDFTDLSTQFTLGAAIDVHESAPLNASPIAMTATIQPARGPRLNLAAQIQPQSSSGSFDLELEARDLDSLHQHFLVRLQDDPPTLSALDGAAGLNLQGSFQKGADGFDWGVTGRLKLKDAGVTTELMHLQGMHLDLPIDLELTHSEEGAVWLGAEQRGSFRLGRSTVGEIELPEIQSELDVLGDSVTLASPLEINLLGGTLEMSKLALRDLAQSSRFAETALSLRGLSLEELTVDSGLPVLEGQLNGELPKVSIAGQTLRVFGGGTLQLLGGEVEIRDISGSEIFTPFPKMRLSADIRRLNLERLTETFDFGRVTGLISGQIDDCELFRGVPTAFKASFHTVPEKGVSQTVDVKAVKNLTILGTGQGTNIFDQGIQRFLSSYRYSALGVDVTLYNDVLLLKGLEQRGERELFLKGGFPFGIDIVNARPGQTVSFQTMVGRLKSLDFDRATFGDD